MFKPIGWLVITGDLAKGIKIFGPYPTENEANNSCEFHPEYQVIALYRPEHIVYR